MSTMTAPMAAGHKCQLRLGGKRFAGQRVRMASRSGAASARTTVRVYAIKDGQKLDRKLRVAVIGGGPAGACAADTLAQGGVEAFLLGERGRGGWLEPSSVGGLRATVLAYKYKPLLPRATEGTGVIPRRRASSCAQPAGPKAAATWSELTLPLCPCLPPPHKSPRRRTQAG